MKQTKKFTKNDFNDSNGMLTTVWGPPLWHFLHTMSFNFTVKPTKEDKINYMHDQIKIILERLITYVFDIDDRAIIPLKTRNINLYDKFKFIHNYSDLSYLNNWLNIASEMKDIYKGIIPFVILQLLAIYLVFQWPALATWLPAYVYG